MQGLVFNIQKFSIHDGPGIRTTVFFNGVPILNLKAVRFRSPMMPVSVYNV